MPTTYELPEIRFEDSLLSNSIRCETVEKLGLGPAIFDFCRQTIPTDHRCLLDNNQRPILKYCLDCANFLQAYMAALANTQLAN